LLRAYRFLDDNRAKLLIPPNADLIVTEVVRASKFSRDGRPLPEQIVLQYVWREELLLEGDRFGRFAGERTTMLCGATMKGQYVVRQRTAKSRLARAPLAVKGWCRTNRHGFSENDFGANPQLWHLLPYASRVSLPHTCKARFRLAGCAFAGR
jgi:hypothetical protein